MAELLIRRPLTANGRLSEPLVRSAAGALAQWLAGGEQGYSCDTGFWARRGHDPHGRFELVAEGRQRRWWADGEWKVYAACEDLPSALYLRLCGYPPVPEPDLHHAALAWCNREEAANEWQSGRNLLRIKTKARHAWRRYERDCEWDIRGGDAVQILGLRVHTLVVTAIIHDGAEPAAVDTAEYGQWHDPRGSDQPGPSCRCYSGVPVTRARGRWRIRGAEVHGRISCWDVVRSVEKYVGCDELPDALVPASWAAS